MATAHGVGHNGGMSADTPVQKRPITVTLVVILAWITAIANIIVGLFLLFGADDAGLIADYSDSVVSARWLGVVGILYGIIVAVVANGLAKGGQFSRFIVSLLMILRILGDVFLLAQWGGAYVGSAIFNIVLSLIILFLLWNSKASRFFNPA